MKIIKTELKYSKETYVSAKYLKFKRFFDVIFSSVFLIFIIPVLILIAILIKLESKGPIFYISKRMGENQIVFSMFKFRSMYLNSDALLKKHSHKNIYSEGDEAIFWKIHDDPRVTKIGKILRKTNLDELPQIINVLKGELSIVGNRPLPAYEAQKIIDSGAIERFNCPHGITGHWQTQRSRHFIPTKERLQLDIQYAQNVTFVNDLKILIRTALLPINLKIS